MPAIGKEPQGAWTAALDVDQLSAAIIGVASGNENSTSREDHWILSQVVDSDGTVRLVTV